MKSKKRDDKTIERRQGESITKGTYKYQHQGPLHDNINNNNHSNHSSHSLGGMLSSLDYRNDNDNDGDISYDSVEFGSQASENDHHDMGGIEEDIFTSNGRIIPSLTNDFLKDDYFSDAPEEEAFYIEEKDGDDNGIGNNGYGFSRRTIMGHFKAYSEPVLMLTRNFSLHTIDEEVRQ